MTCPKCGYEENDEFLELVDKQDVNAIAFDGFDEIYQVECEECGCKYKHIAQYEISLFGERDVIDNEQ